MKLPPATLLLLWRPFRRKFWLTCRLNLPALHQFIYLLTGANLAELLERMENKMKYERNKKYSCFYLLKSILNKKNIKKICCKIAVIYKCFTMICLVNISMFIYLYNYNILFYNYMNIISENKIDVTVI